MLSVKSLWMQSLFISACVVLSVSATGCALEPLEPEVSEDEISALGEAETPLGEDIATDENQGIDTGEGNDPEPNPWYAHEAYRPSGPGPDPNTLLNKAPSGPSKKHDE